LVANKVERFDLSTSNCIQTNSKTGNRNITAMIHTKRTDHEQKKTQDLKIQKQTNQTGADTNQINE